MISVSSAQLSESDNRFHIYQLFYMVTFNMCSKSNLDLGWVAHESYNNVNRASWYSYLRKWRTGSANMPLKSASVLSI